MKKYYIQPVVETVNIHVSGQALCVSNGLGINSGETIPEGGGGD